MCYFFKLITRLIVRIIREAHSFMTNKQTEPLMGPTEPTETDQGPIRGRSGAQH